MKILMIILMSIGIITICYGQTQPEPNDNKINYEKAEAAYSIGDYFSAIKILEEEKKKSEATNSRIEQLLVKSYMNQNQHELAANAAFRTIF